MLVTVIVHGIFDETTQPFFSRRFDACVPLASLLDNSSLSYLKRLAIGRN